MSAVCRNRRCGRPCGEFLCADCTAELEGVLEGVPWLLEQLAVTELRQDRVSRGLRTGSRPDRPLPFDPDAAGLRDELAGAVTGWARHMAESRGVAGPAGSAGDAVVWLREHVASVRLDEAAGEIHAEITRLAKAGLEAINPPPSAIYRGPCPSVVGRDRAGRPVECAMPLYGDRATETWYTTAADETDQAMAYVTCPRCGVRHDVVKLEQALLARLGNQAFDVPNLVRVLRELREPVPRGTIASWISRKQLKPVSADCLLYRLDDVRRLRNLTSHPKGSTA